MPYKIKKTSRGYFVESEASHHLLSHKPLPLSVARAQRIAVAIAESKKTGKKPTEYFK
jgi:hypothetical protein